MRNEQNYFIDAKTDSSHVHRVFIRD